MSQSLSQLYTHIIFHTKEDQSIKENDHPQLYPYIGAILKQNDSIPIIINGTKDHVHIFCRMSKNISIAKIVEEIKRNSSRWIKSINPHYHNFAWQNGYAAFSVSPSIKKKTIDYITNQKEHHKKITFKDEYLKFLQEYEIDYNEKYLW